MRERTIDELLVLAVQRGEPAALERLVRRWQAPLLRHARRLTGEADAAWDVLQESWIAIVRGLGRLDDAAAFRGWAYRIVTHKAADWTRRRQARRRATAAAPPAGPADAPTAADELATLRLAIDGLPDGQRAVVSLAYGEDLRIPEIAAILGIPAGTVKSRLHHARAALRAQLEAAAASPLTRSRP